MPNKRKYLVAVSLIILSFGVNLCFCLDNDFDDRKWSDSNKLPESLPLPTQQTPAPLPTTIQQEYPDYASPLDINQRPLSEMKQIKQDRAALANEKRWQEMAASKKPQPLKTFDDWLESLHIPKEYHLLVELLIASLFVVLLSFILYKRNIARQKDLEDFRLSAEEKPENKLPPE